MILKKPNAHAAELPFTIYHAATVSGTFFEGDFKSRSISAPKCLLPIGRRSPCKGMKPLQGKKVLGTRVNEILCSADGMCDYQPSLDDEVVGRPSRMERSMKAPRLHLSALRIRYFCVPGGALEELPFQTGGRSGPPRPQRPEVFTSPMTFSEAYNINAPGIQSYDPQSHLPRSLGVACLSAYAIG